MRRIFGMFEILFFVLVGSSAVLAQENKTLTEFRPVAIIDDIDRPEGMAVIGNDLYISQYHENGSIIKYDIANKVLSGIVIEGLNYPSGLLAFEDQLIVLEYGSGSMFLVDPKNGRRELMTTGFSRPADVIQFNDDLLVSDFGSGTIYRVNPKTYVKSVFATGLATPAGMAVFKDKIHVVEWGMGRISRIGEDGAKDKLVAENLSSPWGLMVYENELYVAENGSNQISRVLKVKIPVKNSIVEEDQHYEMNTFKDSVTVWKVASMDCSGLDHPEAFCVSERGIYVSEWKSKEVSEILLNSPPGGELLLTGKSKLGHIVTAEPQNIEDADGLGPFSYRWQISDYFESEHWDYIDGRRIGYKLKKESLAGKYIRAELSYTDQGGYEEYVYSNARQIIEPFAPQVALSFHPQNILQPGDTVTLTAELTVIDEDAKQDKVEFYYNDQPLISVESAPFSYSFVVQDGKTTEGYIDPFSIIARGYDSNGFFGEDEKTLYVTNEQNWEGELQSLLGSADADIRVFPNPAVDVLNVVYKKEGSFKIRLFDLNNKVVLSTEITNGFKALDVSKITPGIYILEYTIGKESKAEKVIKL